MAEKLPIPQAMAWKFPGAKCSKTPDGQDIDQWEHPTMPKPNIYVIMETIKEYRAFLKATAYREKRKSEYPPIEEQLDAIWKGGKDMEEMREKINDIKARNPKS